MEKVIIEKEINNKNIILISNFSIKAGNDRFFNATIQDINDKKYFGGIIANLKKDIVNNLTIKVVEVSNAILFQGILNVPGKKKSLDGALLFNAAENSLNAFLISNLKVGEEQTPVVYFKDIRLLEENKYYILFQVDLPKKVFEDLVTVDFVTTNIEATLDFKDSSLTSFKAFFKFAFVYDENHPDKDALDWLKDKITGEVESK
jgi:hypothetical protein